MTELNYVPQLAQILHAYPQTKAFCFDMDGTLLNTEHIHVEASWLAINDIASQLPKPLNSKEIFTQEILGFSDDQVSKHFLMNTVHGLEESFTKRRRFHWSQMLDDHSSLYNEQMLALLEQIVSGGFELGLVTSSTRQQCHELILGSPLEKFFQFLITRDDVENPKPSPEPYQLAMSKLSCSQAKQIIVFEDSEVGFKSAQVAGMTAIKVTWYN